MTLVTVPTSPSAVTTGASTATPSLEPAETTIVWSNARDGCEITSAATPSYSCGNAGEFL